MQAAAVRPCTARENNAEMWFADEGSKEQAEAVALCAACPFRADCAADGMREEYGVWGGITPANPARAKAIRHANRARILREREAQRASVAALTQQGRSKADIAALLGIGTTTVARIRNAA